MYYPVVISLLLLGHVLADFIFQSNDVAKNKGKSKQHMSQHIGWHLLCSIALTILYMDFSLIIIIAAIAVMHCAVDYYKENKAGTYNEFITLLLDQAIHVVLIILLPTIFAKEIDLNGVGTVVINCLSLIFPYIEKITTNDWMVYILGITLYTFNIYGAGFFVEKMTKKLEPKARGLSVDSNTREFINPDKKQTKEMLRFSAATIGKLERILIVTFVLYKAFDAIGAVLTAKSVARFKEFDNPEYAEYFIVGTLASTVIAVLTCSLLNTLR